MWPAITGRILRVALEINKETVITIIETYRPNDDEQSNSKGIF